jgi:hypothetical protein
VHPATAAPIRHADHGGREDAGLGDERTARLGDDPDRIRQLDERLRHRATERLERRDRLGVVRREAAADVEQCEPKALDAGRAHDIPGQCDAACVRRWVE